MQKSVVQDTLEKLGKLAKDSGKAVSQEPKKILENALGTADEEEGASAEETGTTGGKKTQGKKPSDQAASNLMVKKKLDDREKVQKLLQLHRQRLKEEESFQQQEESKEDQEENLEEQEEQKKEQERIVQLQKQDAKDAVLNAPTAASQEGPSGPMSSAKKKKGTKELGRNKD
ncbi:hypothetical protein ACFL1M_00395 [Patescibacteria group bacterium]